MNRKNVFSRIFILVLVFILAALLLTCLLHKEGKMDLTASIGTIDNTAVTVQEYKHFLDKERANTYDFFKNKYGAEDSEEFWVTSYGGITPQSYINKIALDKLKVAKIQQLLAKEHGILKDVSYKAFLEDLNTENKQRKEALKKGGIIYGPEQFNEFNYYEYKISNIAIQLKEKLFGKELFVTEEEQRNFYEKNKDEYVDSKDGSYKAFNEVRGIIIQRLLEDKYQELINIRCRNVKVKMKKELLDKVYLLLS